MKSNIFFLFSWLCCAVFYSCAGPGQEGASTTGETTVAGDTAMTEYEAEDTSRLHLKEALLPPSCDPGGKTLAQNQVWMPRSDRFVCIVARPESGEDAGPGDHRVFRAMNRACEVVLEETLPENFSQDFPYYLSEINYNSNSGLLAVLGYHTFFCYDAKNDRLAGPLEPRFMSERLAADPQSGRIYRIEVWERYVVGYTQDWGAFVYDFGDHGNPQSVMPVAEYVREDESFSSLFALESNKGEKQLLLPKYDYEDNEFLMRPLFKEPKPLNTSLTKSARDNRYIVLRETAGKKEAVAIDMATQELLELPDEVRTKQVSEVLEWIEQQ